MQHIQELLDKGWELRVRKDPGRFHSRPYVAQIDREDCPLGEVSGHCYSGQTFSEALSELESYVAAQGKEGGQ